MRKVMGDEQFKKIMDDLQVIRYTLGALVVLFGLLATILVFASWLGI